MSQNFIWITTQKEMLHCYPNAPKEVDFLKNVHRHLFSFKIYLQVFHDDRDVEFILFKRDCDKWISKMDKNLGTKSCEMISNYLSYHIQKKYPNRAIKIEVSEDGENGSEYFYND